ncbi:transmembrane protein, putative [Medicago truncatula]|uniref:Transmembrane protein, putative n=1 Tax=Medicago truncatula TaxID=3880 RepID=G7I6U7_MEDTR|nr:transmembrane protein, putative [Medicago truncatula]
MVSQPVDLLQDRSQKTTARGNRVPPINTPHPFKKNINKKSQIVIKCSLKKPNTMNEMFVLNHLLNMLLLLCRLLSFSNLVLLLLIQRELVP